MKTSKYILIAAVAISLTGCMSGQDGMAEGWLAPVNEQAPYGNNAIEEHNVITIDQLKTTYLSGISQANDTVRINDDVQIKGRVAGNDIGGNIYNEVALQDESGALLVCIAAGGLYSYLPVGQEILINCKGLHIGYYGNQPQLGTAYTNNSGKTFPSRMSRAEWQTRFKLIGEPKPELVQPEKFDTDRMKDTEYVKACRGKLMYVEGVQLDGEPGTTWAPEEEGKSSGNGVSRTIIVNGKANSDFVVRTSCYADFAGATMPIGKTLRITGIFTIYTSNIEKYAPTWQILLRDESDLEILN